MPRGFWVPRVLPAAVLVGLLVATLASSAPPTVRPDRSSLAPAPPAAALARPAAPAAAAPAATGNGPTLTVSGRLPTAASLSWTEATSIGFANYTLFQSANGSGGPWVSIALITAEATTSDVAGSLTPGATYWWEVEANSNFLDLPSSAMSGVVNATMPTLPFLAVTLVDPTTASLNWTNNATYGGLVAFGWYDVEEVAGTSPAERIANITVAGTHQFTVDALSAGASYAFFVNASDCDGGCGTAAASYVVSPSNPVTIGTPEPLVGSVGSERSVVDVGQSDLFTCTPTGGRSPYTIAWNDGNGTFETGPPSESFAFAATGTPTVQCRITDADASSVTDGTSVVVDSVPTIQASTNRSSADIGGSIAFACNASGGTAPFSVLWAFGDGNGADLGTTTHAFGTPGMYVASCTATDFTGTEVGASFAINVSSLPSLALSAPSLAAAPGTLLTFRAIVSNGSGNATPVHWSFGDGTKEIGASVTHAFTGKGTYLVNASADDSNGVRARSSVTVLVTPIAVLPTVSATSIAVHDPLRFNASASGGAGGPYNYTWTFGDGGRAYGASVSHVFAAVGAYSPVLVVTDRLGAESQVNLTPVHAVVPPPAPPATFPILWILLAGAAAFLGATYVALLFYRRLEDRAFAGSFRWVPFTDPQRTLQGVRICRNCGTPNNAAREGCAACGAPITPPIFG